MSEKLRLAGTKGQSLFSNSMPGETRPILSSPAQIVIVSPGLDDFVPTALIGY